MLNGKRYNQGRYGQVSVRNLLVCILWHVDCGPPLNLNTRKLSPLLRPQFGCTAFQKPPASIPHLPSAQSAVCHAKVP